MPVFANLLKKTLPCGSLHRMERYRISLLAGFLPEFAAGLVEL